MMKILIPNRITPSRYEHFKTQMKELGSPVIECVEIEPNFYYALEGSHRTTAAKELGLTPIPIVIDTIDYSDEYDPVIAKIIDDIPYRESKGLLIEFE